MTYGFNRRQFLELSGAKLLASATAGGMIDAVSVVPDRARADEDPIHAKLARRQNIVIFMPDEMRADSLACYGNPITKTPNFDALAGEGTKFSNCHVQCPVCGPSRCAMLTGWPTSVRGHRSLYYFLRPEEPNLFRSLRRAGYDVFWFGKNDALAAQSFDDSVTRWEDESHSSSMGSGVQDLTPGSLAMLYSATGARDQTSDYRHLQMAFEILRRKESDKPFCIFLPLLQPHPPYTVPKDFYEMYSASDIPAPLPHGLPKKPDFHEGIRKRYGLDKLGEAAFRKIRAVYYGQVSYSDWLLGELRNEIAKNDREKDTALFVTSDHGDYAGDYGLVEKWPSGLEDCLTRVPLIACVPGGKPGVVADGMVELYDLMQTSLELAHTTANHTHFSRSLLPQVFGARGDHNRAAFAEGGYNIYEPQCFEPEGAGGGPYSGKIGLQNEHPVMVSRSAMIRTQTHKLICRPQGQGEFYDLRRDPQETQNLYGDSSCASVQLALQSKLLDHYINTTGIAPMDKDPRDCPPFYPTRTDLEPATWQETILDGSPT